MIKKKKIRQVPEKIIEDETAYYEAIVTTIRTFKIAVKGNSIEEAGKEVKEVLKRGVPQTFWDNSETVLNSVITRQMKGATRR